jgi:acyl transferase domain-containing protein
MRFVAERYRAALEASCLGSDPPQRRPSCELFSSVTGRKLHAMDLTTDYWVNNMIQRVLFLEELLETCTKYQPSASTRARKIIPIEILIEIGPHGALTTPVREIIQSRPALSKITYLSSSRRQQDALDSVSGLLPISSNGVYWLTFWPLLCSSGTNSHLA